MAAAAGDAARPLGGAAADADARSKAAQEARAQAEAEFQKWLARDEGATADTPAPAGGADRGVSPRRGGGGQDGVAVDVKEQVLSVLAEKEARWAQERAEELRSIEAARQCLTLREQKVRSAEKEREELLLRLDDDIKHRSLATEEARHRTIQALEARIRGELHADIEPKLRIAVERELTERVTDEIQTKFQREFEIMCATMKEELDKARQQMETDIEQQLAGKVEARMLPQLKAQAEREVNESMTAHVKETLKTAEKMQLEYKIVVEQRDRLEKELQVCQSVHTHDTLHLNEGIQAEQTRVADLEKELQAARAAMERWEGERELYPLLKEVEGVGNRSAWLAVNEQLNELKRENSKLQADAEFSARELEMLRTQLAALGGGAPAKREEDPESLYAAAKGGNLMKNRFRYTPKKEAHAPTFPFKKEDRERIFLAEMELLQQATAKEQAQRKQAAAQGARSSSRRR